MRLALSGLTAMFCALTLCSNASAEDVVLPQAASQAAGSGAMPACSAGLRLRAVQFDPNRKERSFAVFAGSPRMQPVLPGQRVGGYTIERIERGAVVLATQAQRCSLRLRGEPVSRDLRAVSADAVRGGLHARRPLVSARTTAARSSTNLLGSSAGAARAAADSIISNPQPTAAARPSKT